MTDADDTRERQPTTITFLNKGTGGDAEMLPMLRATRAGGDNDEILQLTLTIARPAALFVGSVDDPHGSGTMVRVAGIATYRVRETPELLEWFADRGAQGHIFGGLELLRYPDEPDIACVQVTWAGFLDGLTEQQLARVCRGVGELAKSCCVELVNEHGAQIPTTY
jgi:hypothetical protein